jgi:hypothetical protein
MTNEERTGDVLEDAAVDIQDDWPWHPIDEAAIRARAAGIGTWTQDCGDLLVLLDAARRERDELAKELSEFQTRARDASDRRRSESIDMQAEIVAARRERDSVAALLGEVCVLATLRPGEKASRPSDHAAINAMQRVIAQRDEERGNVVDMRRERDEARAKLARAEEIAPTRLLEMLALEADRDALRAALERVAATDLTHMITRAAAFDVLENLVIGTRDALAAVQAKEKR